MRSLLVVPLVLAGLALPARAGGPALPVLQRSEAGGFEIRFPATPAESTKDAHGKRLHLLTATDASGTLSYVAGWADLAPRALRAPEAILDLQVATVAGDGRSVEQEPARVHGLPGRAFRIKAADGTAAHGWFFLRGTRLFSLIVTGNDAQLPRAANAFADSFSVRGEGNPDPPSPLAARRLTFAEAGVSLEVHGEPRRAGPQAGKGGPHRITATSEGGLLVEAALFSPFPRDASTDQEADLRAVVQNFAQRPGGVADVQSLTVWGQPAREFRARVKGLDAYSRVIRTEGGVLLLQCMSVPGVGSWAEARAFFAAVRPE